MLSHSLLFLGRLHWSKGLELQADAFAILASEFPDLVWVLVGPDGGEWPALSERIRPRCPAVAGPPQSREAVLWGAT